MRRVVLISGHLGAGKTGLAKLLAQDFDFRIVRTSELLKRTAKKREIAPTRKALQKLGDKLDAEAETSWLLSAVRHTSNQLGEQQSIVVDSVRTAAQLKQFRKTREFDVVHIHLYAPKETMEYRFKNRPRKGKADSYSKADLIKSDEDIQEFARDADVRINTMRNDAKDILTRVAARLGLYSSPNTRCVDVLVGGQYGSEGKGHVSAYLAREYDVLVRVGGPNAGHTVSSASGIYTYHQLPSGAKDAKAKLLLGPGMTIFIPSLLKEIKDCGVGPERLFIDPQAMIIEEFDRQGEKELTKDISSTGSGSGAAAARRIMERGQKSVRLAKDCPELAEFVGKSAPYRGSTLAQLENAYKRRQSILLEGTQGSGLSIFHGLYPHVTSRDTNVAGCLAEAGISPSRVRKILMVVRPTPIRVADPMGDNGRTSGLLKHVTTFEEVAKEAKLDAKIVKEHEKTSTTKRDRRVGWFEWEHYRKACALNAPTDIVLTFADYLGKPNSAARRFEQLTSNAIRFIEELERVAQAPVSLINTRFPRDDDTRGDLRTIIDRRNWTATVAS